MSRALLTLLAVLLLLACGVSGYRFGVAITEGRHAIERQQAVKTALAQQAAHLTAETERARLAEQQRIALEQKLREIDREQTVALRDCRFWTDDERRLLESRRSAYAEFSAAGALSGTLSGNAANGDRRAGDGKRTSGLGLRLPGASENLPGLDR